MRADVDGAVRPDGRGGGDLVAGGKRPLLRAVRIEGIEIAIIRADVDGAVRADGRGGVIPHCRWKTPTIRAVRVDGIEIVIVRPDIDGAVRPDSRGGVMRPSGGKRPLLCAVRVDGVEVMILMTRRRWCHPPRRPGRSRSQPRWEMPTFACRPGSWHRDSHPLIRHRWCRPHRWPGRSDIASGGKFPLLRAVRVEGIEIVIIRPDIDGAVRADSRGGIGQCLGVQTPIVARAKPGR